MYEFEEPADAVLPFLYNIEACVEPKTNFVFTLAQLKHVQVGHTLVWLSLIFGHSRSFLFVERSQTSWRST